MTSGKGESPAQEKRGERMMKRNSEKKEEELKGSSRKKEQKHEHTVSEPPKSIPFNASKAPSAPTLLDSFNNSRSPHSFSDGDLQMVIANHSHSSLSDGAIKVVKEELNNSKSMVSVMDVEDAEEEGTRGDEVSKKEGKWFNVLLGLRIAAFVFCKIAFVLLAADKRVDEGLPENVWFASETEHLYDYNEFKYCLSVNVIGCVYCGLQICDMVKYMLTKRHTMNRKLRVYFNFAMDQALAYLLISASSTTVTWVNYWTKESSDAYKFVEVATASVVLSFFAFVAFASSSIVSAFIFCRFY
ncbi:hypothetical protein VNO78_34049 [Psophocarpus tetragonolobus]|uniref:CASP-like protein n=1 Tax=Psophocarpus tetragonolobus TaxID=3891 RepID=A0AAN9RLS7_PSOTE